MSVTKTLVVVFVVAVVGIATMITATASRAQAECPADRPILVEDGSCVHESFFDRPAQASPTPAPVSELPNTGGPGA